MSVQFVNSGADIDVGVLAETTPGTFETSAAFELILNTGTSPDFPTEQVSSADVGDQGGPLGRRTVSRGGDIDFPMHFRHDANKIMEAHAFRDDWATEVTITGSSDIDLVLAGTHQDGSTGLQLSTTTGGFNSLITYGGATANGAVSLLLLIEGFTNAINNQPVAVKAVWNNGSNDLIDIDAGYAGGASTENFGAGPKIGETLTSAVIHAGEAVRNQRKGNPGRRTLSVMLDRFLLTEGRFDGVIGWVANDLNFEISGKGEVTETVNGNGRGWVGLSNTPVNGQAVGSHFVDNNPDVDFFIGGKDLQHLSIVTFANALNSTEKPINLSDKNVSAFSWSLAGNVNVITDVVGTDQVLPRRGLPDFTGNLTWYVADDTIIADIVRLGSSNQHQKGAIHVVFQEPGGNWKGLTLPRNEFEQTGGTGGGDGEESGTLNFGSEAKSKQARTAIMQQWTAF